MTLIWFGMAAPRLEIFYESLSAQSQALNMAACSQSGLAFFQEHRQQSGYSKGDCKDDQKTMAGKRTCNTAKRILKHLKARPALFGQCHKFTIQDGSFNGQFTSSGCYFLKFRRPIVLIAADKPGFAVFNAANHSITI